MISAYDDRVPARIADCQTERLEGETLVFCPAGSQTIYLNDSAALVWALCDGTRTVRQIVEFVAAAYPEAAGRLAGDVRDTLYQLEERGAIRLA